MRVLSLALFVAISAGGSPALAADGVPEYASLLADCAASGNAACPGQQTALAPQWSKALSGDLPSLRNFAFCLADGCYGAFKVDPVRSCALRIVVAAIGERPVPRRRPRQFRAGLRAPWGGGPASCQDRGSRHGSRHPAGRLMLGNVERFS